VFLTATQARAIRDERLKKLFDFLQTMIRQNAGEAFSIPVSEARISDLEFLKPSLKSANWSFRLITHNKSGGNTWLFEPVTEVHSVNEVKEVEVVKGSTAGWGSVWAEGSR
jgi:hypothetical protein